MESPKMSTTLRKVAEDIQQSTDYFTKMMGRLNMTDLQIIEEGDNLVDELKRLAERWEELENGTK